jgi:1,4-dihydroxy-2-naphthoate octaprenyltransferase
VNGWLLLCMATYVAVSKAYSWRGIRIKKYGLLSWLVVVFFQGAFTFMMVNMCCENSFDVSWFTHKNIESMIIATFLIGGFYPLTQIYQHEEDSARGDMTISYRLGIMGTFIFTAGLFIVANVIAYYYFTAYYSSNQFFIFNLCLLPVTGYFLYWFAVTLRDKARADFTHSARMTIISSLSMIVCFGVIFFMNHGM